MKLISPYLLCFIFLLLLPDLMSQEPVNDTLSTNNLELDRIDSLHMKMDSLLLTTYGIKQQTNEKGQKLNTAMGLKVSTLGLGLELILAFNEKFSLRFSGSFYELDTEAADETIGVETTHSNFVGGAYLVADYQVISFMHVTGGLIYKASKEEGLAKPTEGVTIGGIQIPADIVGQITYAIEQKSIGYYAGVGFGRTISFKRRVAASISLGGYYIPADTQVQVQASGLLSPTANTQTKNTIAANAGNQKFYPFVSVQVSYRLFKN